MLVLCYFLIFHDLSYIFDGQLKYFVKKQYGNNIIEMMHIQTNIFHMLIKIKYLQL